MQLFLLDGSPKNIFVRFNLLRGGFLGRSAILLTVLLATLLRILLTTLRRWRILLISLRLRGILPRLALIGSRVRLILCLARLHRVSSDSLSDEKHDH